MIYKKYVHDIKQNKCDENNREKTSSMKNTNSHSIQKTMLKICQTKNFMKDSADEKNI
jgi:hypothetical protein